MSPEQAEQAKKALDYIEYIATKQGNIEQRQCDNQGEGTDASRLCEAWARGKHANVTGHALEVFRGQMLATGSWRATSYASLFGEKDFIRAEKFVFLFDEQFVRGIESGPRDSEAYEDIGKGLAFLPIFRGLQLMQHEKELEGKPYSVEYTRALDLKPLLPGEKEGYDEQYSAVHELMLPITPKCEPLQSEESEWSEMRHKLRRESLLPEKPHPFEKQHESTPDELHEMLSPEVRDYVRDCPVCEGIENVRDKFTRAVVFWSQWYEDKHERKTEGHENKHVREWIEKLMRMDELFKAKRAMGEKSTEEDSSS